MSMGEINKAYVIAGVVSVLLYVFGVISGLLIQNSSTEYTTQQIESLQRRVENAQLEYIYLNTIGEKLGCNSLSVLIENSTNEVGSIGRELVSLENKGQKGKTFYSLKSEYALLSTRAWILNSYVNERCHSNSTIIMYFYSIPCNDCLTQGYILDDLRDNHLKDRARIFVLDFGSDEPIVQTLRVTYNITTTPSLIVGDKVYSGLTSKEVLLNAAGI